MPSLKINDPSIDWMSRDSHFFFDTRRLRAGEWKSLKPPFFPGHIYLFTSSHRKIAVLSKEAFLVSARAVSRHLKCSAEDRWLIALPLTHVAGIAVLARSFVSSFSTVRLQPPWDPKTFWNILKAEKITLSALVPAQVYDVVQRGFSAPKSVRAVLVGGGPLSPSLYRTARGLGWPLLPSYGLTEICSSAAVAQLSSVQGPASLRDTGNLFRRSDAAQISFAQGPVPAVADSLSVIKGIKSASDALISSAPPPAGFQKKGLTAGGYSSRLKKKTLKPGELESGELKPADSPSAGPTTAPPFPDLGILPHIQLKVEKGTLRIQSKALLKGYFDPEENRFWDPKSNEGWFDTGDLGELSGKNLKVKGRREQQIKILGELTDLTELSRQLKSVVSSLRLKGRFLLVPVPDVRKTWDLQLVTTSFDTADILKAVQRFNKETAPFQRIKTVYSVPKLPGGDLSGLFKISPADIRKQIGLPSAYTDCV